MHKYGIAREARDLGSLFDAMKDMADDDIPIYLENARARIAFMGFDLEDVIKVGLHRLGRVSAGMVAIVEDENEWPVFVTTRNWRREAGEALEWRAEHISWVDQTFLQICLTKHDITSRELTRVEGIVENAYVQRERRLQELEEATQEPAPQPANDQFKFDV